jgi:hypothetical protein
MFRYGGPIKEGIMSGIRENYKRAGLVGDPVYPRTNGREHHSRVSAASKLPIVGGILQKTRGWMPRAWDKIKGWTGTTSQAPFTPVHQVQSKGGKLLNLKPRWKTGGVGPNVGDVGKVWTPHGWVARDPLYKLGSAAWQGKGYLGKPLKWAGKTIATPTGGIGLVYIGGKWLWPDGKEANTDDVNEHLNKGGGKSGGVPGGGDPGMMGDGSWFAEQAEKEANIAKQKEWNNRIKKYRDIMDIKGMNKEAAYKSLVDASKLIQESQDFKGDIKSGKLINQVIQAASKQFDKPAKTSDAINTLILQNELKKDLNKEENALAKLLTQKKIQVADKTLKGDTTAEVIQAIALRTGMPQGDQLNQLVSLNNPELNLKTIPTKDMGNKDPITYIAEIVSSVNNDPKTPNYPAGNYVIKDKVVQITEDGTITPIPINALK